MDASDGSSSSCRFQHKIIFNLFIYCLVISTRRQFHIAMVSVPSIFVNSKAEMFNVFKRNAKVKTEA